MFSFSKADLSSQTALVVLHNITNQPNPITCKDIYVNRQTKIERERLLDGWIDKTDRQIHVIFIYLTIYKQMETKIERERLLDG